MGLVFSLWKVGARLGSGFRGAAGQAQGEAAFEEDAGWQGAPGGDHVFPGWPGRKLGSFCMATQGTFPSDHEKLIIFPW